MRTSPGRLSPAHLFSIFIFAYFCMAASCQPDQIKNALDATIDTMASATGQVWEYSRDFVNSDSGPALICKGTIDKYVSDPRPDDVVEAEALAECQAKIDKFEHDLKQSLDACASALKALEHCLNSWDQFAAGKKIQVVVEAASAMADLMDVLTKAGVDVPGYLVEAMGYIEGLANSLKEDSP